MYLPGKYLHYMSTTFKSALSRQYICLANICIIRLLHSSQPYPANIFALQISALYVYYIQSNISRQYICPANICIIRLLHSSQPYPANIFALQISALYVYYIQVILIPPIYLPCKYLHYTSTTFKSSLSRQYICPANICIIRLLHSSQPYPANIFALQISALYVYYIQVSLIPPIYLPCKYLHFTSTTFKSSLSRQYICLANICILRLLHSSHPYPANIFALQISALYVYYIQSNISRQYICPANICIIRLLHSSQPYPANIFGLQISALYVYCIQVSLIPPIYLPGKYLHYTSTTFKLTYPANIFALQISALYVYYIQVNIPPIYLPSKYLHYTSTTFKLALSRQYICPANICIIRLLHSSQPFPANLFARQISALYVYYIQVSLIPPTYLPCRYLHYRSTTFKLISRQYICPANICIIRLLHSGQPYPANIFALQISALYVYYIQVSLIPPIYLPGKYLHYTSTTFKLALSRQYICPANICILCLLHSS